MKNIKFRNMKTFFPSLLILLSILSCNGSEKSNTVNLAGKWSFRADPEDIGIHEKWYSTDLPETIMLPGSMTENNKGEDISINTKWTGNIIDSSWFFDPEMEKYRLPGNIKLPFWLQPLKYYVGAAWYQKKVKIPASWKGKNIQLFLERCHWETRIWVDDIEAGMQNSLGTPHNYDLTQWLTPGAHTLTICVDNRIKNIVIGKDSHSISDQTQGNWNGLAGSLELQAHPMAYISEVNLYPDLLQKLVKVQLNVNNTGTDEIEMKINLQAREVGKTGTHDPLPLVTDVKASPGINNYEISYPMGNDLRLWDEFHPNLYKMVVNITANSYDDEHLETVFGMREFKANGTQFTINGNPIFLRGTLECAIFPKTGYPPTDTASWMRIFRIARAYGLNHMRFHSWCPPEAAFQAADYTGFYLHVECSSWANSDATLGNGKPVDEFIYAESEHMVKEYGNHPSFCILLYGNEPGGEHYVKWLTDFVTYWKNKDPRRLYSSGAGWPIIPETDFNSTPVPRIQGWGEGLSSIINSQPPRNDYDWSEKISMYDKPTISHEIGQWCVYPDFKEISAYTGILKPKNFEIFREILQENHMEHLADSFLLASGKLQALCYKADIEAALRTPGFAGFQLLDIHDFPGQGTALVGVLNAFWESKGYISEMEFSRFCNATVPLIRLTKMIYTSDETLRAPVEIAHFGETELKDVTPEWYITDCQGNIRFKGMLAKTNIPIGNCIQLGVINQSLNTMKNPEKLTINISVSSHVNNWDIWVFPSKLPETTDPILVTSTLDSKAEEILAGGGKVLLTLKKGSLKPDKGGDIAVGFSSIFWNTAWTGGQPPHTLGIYCNPQHPALARFPTEYHSNWQWWDAMSHSNALILSEISPELQPIVRIIDNWFTNRSLAMIFEAKIGTGKIIVCGVDLLTGTDKRPEARQLLFSLKSYMAGNNFHPFVSVDMMKLKALLN
jgi:hypothetical protein